MGRQIKWSYLSWPKNDCGQNDEWTAHWLKNRRDFNLLQTKEWATLIWNPCSIDIFTSNRIIKGHSFSLDSQHETAITLSLIVITQAGNFPFNHDLHNTKGFVFPSAKSKEKDKESLKIISHSRNYKGTSFRCNDFWDRLGGCLDYHRPIITNVRPPKQSQKSLHTKLVPILRRVSEAGN